MENRVLVPLSLFLSLSSPPPFKYILKHFQLWEANKMFLNDQFVRDLTVPA